ncbi:MAG: T9SS type A sorting domain-containing protein [Taibaiella sp.]|jgi:hypothetical protein
MIKPTFTNLMVCCTLLGSGQALAQTTFTNNNPITTYSFGPGNPFPSTLVVSGLNNYTTKVVVTLTGINIPQIVCNQVYVQSPTGQIVCLFSKSGAAFYNFVGDLIFDQDSPNQPPEPYAEDFIPGTYHPYIANAQALPASTTARLDSFNTYNPNGTWSLYENGIIGLSNVGSIASWSLTITATNTPLPLSLTSFEVHKQGSAAILAWETTTEKNTEVFKIERSADGKTFEPIGSVKATGNSTASGRQYTYTDRVPLVGHNYYRLRMEDKDGTYTYSTIATANFSSVGILLYPNPFKDKLIIDVTDLQSTGAVTLVNIGGVKVLSQVLTFEKGNQVLDVSSLPTGIYFALIEGRTIRVVKQ